MNKIPQFNRVVYFTFKNQRATQSLVNHLVTSPDDSVVLPYIDHPGPLSSEILSRNFKSLTVCEPDTTIRTGFKDYVTKHHPHKNVLIHPEDLFDLSYKTHSDVAQKRCAEIVRYDNITIHLGRRDADDRCVKLLVPLLKSKYEAGFLRNLYYHVCLKLGLCSNRLVHYYFLMSDRQRAYMDAKPSDSMRLYRSSSVLYNTIFRMRTLESYDLEDCFGINLRKIQNTAAARNSSYTKVHLILLEPRLDVLDGLRPRSLVEFRFLVMQMMHKRKALVVSFLDRFFDQYIADVNQIGIDKSTRCGDLSRQQYYKLFIYLSQRPDYEGSTFLQAVASGEESVQMV